MPEILMSRKLVTSDDKESKIERLCQLQERVNWLYAIYHAFGGEMCDELNDEYAIPMGEPFTHAERQQFLSALEKYGRASVHELCSLVPTRSLHQVYAFAEHYFRILDSKLIECMYQADFIDARIKQEILKSKFEFNVFMLAFKDPPNIFRQDLVTMSNCCFKQQLGVAIAVRDYTLESIEQHIEIAERFLPLAITRGGEYAIRTITCIGLVFKEFCAEEEFVIGVIAQVVDLEIEFCAAIAFSVMCISSL